MPVFMMCVPFAEPAGPARLLVAEPGKPGAASSFLIVGDMLRGIRNASSNWLGKTIMTVVMAVLIISFAVWGIADIFKGFGQSTLASIGRTEISIEQFRQIYNERLQQFGRQLGRALTPEQARALGIDRQILQQTIAEAVLDEAARARGLGLSDAALRDVIVNDPAFRGLTGAFDASRFQQIIRQAGYTEQRFMAEQRKQTLRREIAATISAGLTPPASQIESLLRYQNEERAVDFIKLGPAQAGTIEAPAPEILTRYFEDNKARFRAPEFRKLAILALTPESVAKTISISDDDAKRVFDERKDKFATPEKRQLLQLVFPDEAAATAARAKIEGGASFEALATEIGKKREDIDLGTLAKSDMIDKTVGDAAFALKAGDVSQPVKGRFGTVLIKAEKIEPGVAPGFDALKDAIKADLASERARGRLQELHNKVEDERAGGAGVGEAAKKLGIEPINVDAIDRSGRDPDGNLVATLQQTANVLAQAFTSDVGVENDPVQLGGGYIWFDVLGVTKSRDRTFDEAKSRVEERWRADQVEAKLRAKGGEIVKALGEGKNLADIAASLGVKVERADKLKRREASDALPQSIVGQVFTTAKDKAGDGGGKDANEWIVYRVTQITLPDAAPGSDSVKRATEALQSTLSDDLLAQYVLNLEAQIGTKINQTAFNQITGATAK